MRTSQPVWEEKRERALLVGFATSSPDRWREMDSLEELEQLARTAGAEVFEKLLQIREKPDPSYLLGRGKVQEIRRIVETFGLDLVIINRELSPSQHRNLEEAIGVKIVDRTELILDIFAQHARTAEAKIQVELAQLEYRLSKLVGRGAELSRLGGGIGTRGPGEKKLEIDRRRLEDRIAFLRRKLRDIERTRALQRKRRRSLFKVSLVGYTNTGKSTLMNQLTRAGVRVEDQLFATLDAVTRVLYHPDRRVRILLSDTVGFIENLPHHLVASFRATLGVVQEADLLAHVVDVSHPRLEERMTVVEQVLEEIGAAQKPRIVVFNKMDLLLETHLVDRLRERYPESVFVSALAGEGLDTLLQRIYHHAERYFETLRRPEAREVGS